MKMSLFNIIYTYKESTIYTAKSTTSDSISKKNQLTVLNTSLIKTATQKISADIISTFYRMNGETVRLQQ